MNHDNDEPQATPQGIPRGRRKPTRSTRDDHVQEHPGAHAETRPENPNRDDVPSSIREDELRSTQHVYAEIRALLQENHLHLPMPIPSVEDMAQMKKHTPEVYSAFVNRLESETKADEVTRIAPYVEPSKAAARGQYLGLFAVLAVLLLCAYLAHLGHVVSASLVAVFDLVALASVFARARENQTDKPTS